MRFQRINGQVTPRRALNRLTSPIQDEQQATFLTNFKSEGRMVKKNSEQRTKSETTQKLERTMNSFFVWNPKLSTSANVKYKFAKKSGRERGQKTTVRVYTEGAQK
jgi:hypothetical protein